MTINTENNKKTEGVKESLAVFLSSLKNAKSGMEKLSLHTAFPLFGEIYAVFKEIKNLKEGIIILEEMQFKSVDDFVSVKKLREAELSFSKNDFLEDFQFPDYQSQIDSELLMHVEIELQLDAFDRKAIDLLHRGYKSAGEEASWVVFNLRNLNQWFFKEKRMDYENYKSSALVVINNSRSELEKHRGCKQLLGNLILLILTVGTAFIINKAVNGHFLFFQKTDSAKQLDGMSQALVAAKHLSP